MTKSIIKYFSSKKTQNPMTSLLNSTEQLKLMPVLLRFYQKTEKERILSNSF
jgi:hypothetical protein